MELLDVIKKFNFTNIIVLDDEDYFNQKVGDIIDDTSELYQMMIDKYGVEVFSKEITDCSSDLYEIISPYIEENPYRSINRIKNDVSCFKYISSIEQFDINILNDGNVLWFVDIAMDIPSNYNHINILYKYFYERNKSHNKNDIFILFSSGAQDYDTLEKIESFLKDDVKIDNEILKKSCVALNTNVIEKNDINAQLIYYLILKSSKSKYFDFLNIIIDESIERFKHNIYDPKTALELFSYDYLTEGKSFDVSLFDVFELDLKTNYNQKLDYSMFSIMNDAIDYYLEGNEDGGIIYKVIWRIGKIINEIEMPSCVDISINKMRHDVSFGDIISIDDKFYMIGNQSCDITIRENGTRNDSYATLIPIVMNKYSDEELKNYKISVVSKIAKTELGDNKNAFEEVKRRIKENFGFDLKNSDRGVLKDLIKYDGCVYSIDFAPKLSMITLPFWCLDCVVCNSRGVVDFKYISDGLRFPLKKRIENAKKEYIKLNRLNSSDDWKFLSIAYCAEEVISSITRIGKIDSDISNLLYNKFLLHKSRISKDKITKLTK